MFERQRQARFNRLHREIWEDLGYILELRQRAESDNDRRFFVRQVENHLKPLINGRLQRDLESLRDFFAPGPSKVDGFCRGTPPRQGFSLTPGHLHAIGSHGAAIRIFPPALRLTDTILSGIMFHQATHYVLGTTDIGGEDPDRPGDGRLKGLQVWEYYQNADNWRLFYQKMRSYRRD